MGIENDVYLLENFKNEIETCISVSDTFDEFKKCMETENKEYHFDLDRHKKKFRNVLKK